MPVISDSATACASALPVSNCSGAVATFNAAAPGELVMGDSGGVGSSSCGDAVPAVPAACGAPLLQQGHAVNNALMVVASTTSASRSAAACKGDPSSSLPASTHACRTNRVSTNMSSKKIELDHKDMVHDSAIDYYGKRLATASSDSTVKIVNIGGASAPSQLLAALTGHYGPVWRVGWAHPKYGSILASCGYDGRVIVWKEGATGQWSQAHVFSNHKSSVNSIAWAPYELGLCLACGSSDGSISVMSMRPDGGWDTATIERAHPVGVTAVSWAPATALGSMVGSDQLVHKLVSGGFDCVVKVWEFVNGGWKAESALVSDMHAECVRDVSWAPVLGLAKSTIASASQDGKVVIWTKGKGDKWEGKMMRDLEAPVWRVSWSLTGNILSVAAGEGAITLWKEASDGQWEQLWTKASDGPQEQATEEVIAAQ